MLKLTADLANWVEDANNGFKWTVRLFIFACFMLGSLLITAIVGITLISWIAGFSYWILGILGALMFLYSVWPQRD